MWKHLRRARIGVAASVILSLAALARCAEPLQVSGIYPHLASYNGHGECGIGAVVPWAGKLWWLTYPPHEPRGSKDKLYSIGDDFALTIHEESVGGTHAGRMIHRESEQLIIGPCFISKEGKIRAADVKNKLVGRITGVARHLTDPANKVYIYDMEGMLYEVDIHSLEAKRLFEKPVPGWHGKGAYTGQGRLIISNNGEHAAGRQNEAKLLAGSFKRATNEDAGVLAEWDGKDWRIVERRQFTDVTGPGGINGATHDSDPVWAIGWDQRSVILKLLDGGKWSTFRLPKASHTFDPKHGWYTEWPRIRQIADDYWMMVMHGAMYDFPPTFRTGNTSGIRPMCQHLRYIPDVSAWGDKVVLAADDTSIMQNKLAGQSQSNLWFGSWEQLMDYGGPPLGFGGVWLGDDVKAGVPSDPFLTADYEYRCLHLSTATDAEVVFTVEMDTRGDGNFREFREVTVPARGYAFMTLPINLPAQWLRIVSDKHCKASAYFHLRSAKQRLSSPAKPTAGGELFAGLASPDEVGEHVWTTGLLRPAAHSRDLLFLATQHAAGGEDAAARLFAIDETLKFTKSDDAERRAEIAKLCAIEKVFDIDAASVIVQLGKQRLRLPKGHEIFDSPPVPLRAERESVSERTLANIHGTFYEVPRAETAAKEDLNWYKLKPVATHNRLINDYCTWRGLFVIAGVRADAKPSSNLFKAGDDSTAPGLWFGNIDDLWKLGKPVGVGGPWKQTAVKAGEASDPYLMTGYDRKRVELSHDSDGPVTMRIEVDVYNGGFWKPYQEIVVPAGEIVEHKFDDAFGAHWVRVTADHDCRATATFHYE